MPTARPALDYAANVYHGVDSAELPFDAAGGDSLVSFGRIHPDKGTAEAIEIAAAAAGRRLVICGIVHDEAYFRECVEPRIDGDRVTYLGSVGPAGGRRFSAARRRSCTRSPSPSRSACRSSSR